MSQILLNINDESKLNILLKFLKSLNYVNVKKVDEIDVSLTAEQKNILDHRRATAKLSDFIPWKEAKKQLNFKLK